MTQLSRCLTILPVLSALCLAPGCAGNSGPPPVPVSGKVTLDGKPLPDGFVYFKTITTGTLERFDIVNGHFSGKAQAGTRRVEIYATRPVTIDIDGKNVEVQENILDLSFNTESTLTADVLPEGPNEFRFEVRKK